MSQFSNRPDRAAEEALAYQKALVELVGDRDPLTILPELVHSIRQILAGFDAAKLTVPECHGRWNMLQVLQHLFDSELVWAYRLRSALAEDRPRLRGYDQNEWVEQLHTDDEDADTLIGELAALRTLNLRLVASMPPLALQRVVVHEERGEESVGDMLVLYAGHDLVHQRQLMRIRDAIT